VLGRHTQAVSCIIRCCLALLAAMNSYRYMSGESRRVTVELAVLARTSGMAFCMRPRGLLHVCACCQSMFSLFRHVIMLCCNPCMRACYAQQQQHQNDLQCTSCACAAV
jgi:hypothetical protein